MGPKLKIGLIIGGILLALIILTPSKNVAKAISRDNHFEYSTSITGKYNTHDRANVYTSDDGVIETARYIIKEQRPISHSDLNNTESISITYDDYYVLVYKGDNNLTYIQVSSRTYVHRNGYYGLYRPYNRSIMVFYDTSYRNYGYGVDTNRYGSGGYYNTRTNTYKTTTTKSTPPKISNTTTTKSTKPSTDKSKIKTDQNATSKIRTQNNTSSSSSKSSSTTSKSSSTSKSIRSGSSGSRTSFGGGTSFGK